MTIEMLTINYVALPWVLLAVSVILIPAAFYIGYYLGLRFYD